jgi:hypothetical protein
LQVSRGPATQQRRSDTGAHHVPIMVTTSLVTFCKQIANQFPNIRHNEAVVDAELSL